MFHNCWSLKNISDIEKLDISNVSDMSFMFHNCTIDFNEIKKWNISNDQNSFQMFSNFDNYINNIVNIFFNHFNGDFTIVSVVNNGDILVKI